MLAERSKIKGERFVIDISSSSPIIMCSKKHWLLALKIVLIMLGVIFEKKPELKDVLLELSKDLKSTQGIDGRYIHCDNADENKSLE